MNEVIINRAKYRAHKARRKAQILTNRVRYLESHPFDVERENIILAFLLAFALILFVVVM